MSLTKKKRFIFKLIIIVLLIILIALATAGYYVYNAVYKPNITLNGKESVSFYIRSTDNYEDVLKNLYDSLYIVNKSSFEWVATKKSYPSRVKPGRYILHNNMSNNEIINLLRSGKQEPVKLIFNNIRTKEQLAGKVSQQIEADSAGIMNLLNNGPFLEEYGLNPDNILVMFLPNTYEFFWNTSEEKFMEKMHNEYLKFWNDERSEKAAEIGLSPEKISVLASIVQSETNKKDEMSRMAGVYINRLNKGMLLQADPTVVYAWGDFSIRRVLLKHLEIDSPYNTYKYTGLPPGPITLPEPSTIEKVLDYEIHDYLFFCAKDDLSGYHAFAISHATHSANAARYQRALNARNIR